MYHFLLVSINYLQSIHFLLHYKWQNIFPNFMFFNMLQNICVEREREICTFSFSLSLSPLSLSRKSSPILKNCETRLMRERKSIRVTQNTFMSTSMNDHMGTISSKDGIFITPNEKDIWDKIVWVEKSSFVSFTGKHYWHLQISLLFFLCWSTNAWHLFWPPSMVHI